MSAFAVDFQLVIAVHCCYHYCVLKDKYIKYVPNSCQVSVIGSHLEQ